MEQPEPLAPITLRMETEINGRVVMARQHVSPAVWAAAQEDPPMRVAITDQLRRVLGEAIVREVDPFLTVYMPTELDEAMMRRAMEELEQEPAPCPPGEACAEATCGECSRCLVYQHPAEGGCYPRQP